MMDPTHLVLTTKLFVPQPRTPFVLRPHLLSLLDDGLSKKLTLISASAGFGKTTLVVTWLHQLTLRMAGCGWNTTIPSSVPIHPLKFCWLSLDEHDNDPARFLTYLIAALQTVEASIGASVQALLHAPAPSGSSSLDTSVLEALLTSVINDL
jgi:LuxR family transcriptional regulator, maltose regulon positive regulatory protein